MVKEKRKKPNEKTNTTRRKRNTKDDSHELIKMNQYSAEPEDVRKENFKTKNQNESKILEIFEKQSKSKILFTA